MVVLGSWDVFQNFVASEHIFGETPIFLWKRVSDHVPLRGQELCPTHPVNIPLSDSVPITIARK